MEMRSFNSQQICALKYVRRLKPFSWKKEQETSRVYTDTDHRDKVPNRLKKASAYLRQILARQVRATRRSSILGCDGEPYRCSSPSSPSHSPRSCKGFCECAAAVDKTQPDLRGHVFKGQPGSTEVRSRTRSPRAPAGCPSASRRCTL